MAEDKKLEIKLAATGGDAAAREVAKPGESATVSIEKLEAAMAKLQDSPESIDTLKEALGDVADASRAFEAEMRAGGASVEEIAGAIEPLTTLLDMATDALAEQASAATDAAEASKALTEQAANLAEAAEAAANADLAAQLEASAEAARQAESSLTGMLSAAAGAGEALVGMAASGADLPATAETLAAYGEQIIDIEADLRRMWNQATDSFAEATHASKEDAEALKNSTLETKQKEIALGRLHNALGRLIPGYSAVRQTVNDLAGAWKASASAGAGFGERLLAMAGGPVGIAIAAITALAGAVFAYRQRMAALDADIAATAEELSKLGTEADETKTDVQNLAEELNALADTHEANREKWQTAIDLTRELRDAQNELKIATIDAQVASGAMTREEGAAQKGELAIAALEEELAVERERVALERSRADQMLRAAKAQEQKAREQVNAAAAAQAKEQADLERLKGRGENASQMAQQVRTPGVSAAGIIATLGGEDEVRKRLGLLDGAVGVAARFELDKGKSVESVLGPAEREALARQLQREADIANKAAPELEKAIEVANAALKESQAVLDDLRKQREAAEKEVADATAAQNTAAAREQIARDYTIPAMETRVDTSRADEQRRKEKEQADAAAKAREQGEKQINKDALGLANEITGLARGLTPNDQNNPLIGKLNEAVAMLKDGAESPLEAGVVAAILEMATRQVAATEAARAKLEQQAQVARDLQARLRNLETQTATSRR